MYMCICIDMYIYPFKIKQIYLFYDSERVLDLGIGYFCALEFEACILYVYCTYIEIYTYCVVIRLLASVHSSRV